MQQRPKSVLAALATLALALATSPAVQARDYLFSQGGFSGGGLLSGGFSATDTDNNGTLDFNFDNFTAFSLTFSGDSQVPDFGLALEDLAGLVYELGGDFIGDDGPAGTGEGMVAFSQNHEYFSGIGPTGGLGGTISFAGNSSSTSSPISVSPVPEAQTWAMLLAGLGLMVLLPRRRA